MSGPVAVLGVATLGGAGSLLRFAVHRAVVRHRPSEFPLATFIVNVVGALLLGLLFGLHVAHDVMLLAGLGLLGGLTTFSTWMYESERLVVDGYRSGALRNVAFSTVAGLAAVALGVAIGGALG